MKCHKLFHSVLTSYIIRTKGTFHLPAQIVSDCDNVIIIKVFAEL